MGFTITYGMPGLFGILFLVLLVGGAGILLFFLLDTAKIAHDEVVDDIKDEGGDLEA